MILDGIALNAAEGDLEVRRTTIDGWHNSAPSIADDYPRAIADGSFAIPGRIGSKLLAIVGQIRGPRELVALKIEQLVAIEPHRTMLLDVYDRTLGVRTMHVQREGTVEIIWNGGPVAFFRIPLKANDPMKYGERSSGTTSFASGSEGRGLRFPLFSPNGYLSFGPPATSSGSVTVTNAGTAPASPVFTVAGPTPEGGFSITETTTGARITFLGTVPAGSRLVLDSADGSVLIDGSGDRSTDTLVDAWPVVPAGSSSTFLFAPESSTSAATLTVDVVATYR